MPRFTFLYSNPDAFATTLLAGLLELYGTEVFEWEPETIERELKESQKLSHIPDLVMDKIQAAMIVLTTNQFYMYSEAFENICNAFNHEPPEFRIMTPPSSEEAAWAILEAELIDPTDEPGENVYSAEVRKYIRTVLDTEGICKPSEVFLSIGVPTCTKPYTIPDLESKIDLEQRMKLVRIRAYVEKRYEELTSEMQQFFPGSKLPTLQELSERRPPR